MPMQQQPSAPSSYNPWGNTNVLNQQNFGLHHEGVQNTVINQDLHQNLFIAMQTNDPQMILEACSAVAAARADADLTRQQAEAVIIQQQQAAMQREAELGVAVQASQTAANAAETARQQAVSHAAAVESQAQVALQQQAGTARALITEAETRADDAERRAQQLQNM